MTSKQLLHMLCGYYAITEKQIVYFLQEKAYKNKKLAGIKSSDSEFVDESVVYSIINDVIISLIVEDEHD